MRWQCPMDNDPGTGRDAVLTEVAGGECRGTVPALTSRAHLLIAFHRDEQERCRRRGPETTEPSAGRTSQVEHAEMEPCRRFDEYDFARLHHGRPADDASRVAGAVRTNSVSKLIASRSTSPAVLSTMICNRSSSLSMVSRGTR